MDIKGEQLFTKLNSGQHHEHGPIMRSYFLIDRLIFIDFFMFIT